MTETSRKTSSAKAVLAVIGAGAVMTMGAFAAVHSHGQGDAATAKSSIMSIGVTTTASKPAHTPATSMAVPVIKGPAPLPAEEQAAE